MAYVHMSVNQMSKEYLANERRYNYTTPKSFLEQIKLYRSLLAQKSKDLTNKMERLENGLQKLNSTSAQVFIYTVFWPRPTVFWPSLCEVRHVHTFTLGRFSGSCAELRGLWHVSWYGLKSNLQKCDVETGSTSSQNNLTTNLIY